MSIFVAASGLSQYWEIAHCNKDWKQMEVKQIEKSNCYYYGPVAFFIKLWQASWPQFSTLKIFTVMN